MCLRVQSAQHGPDVSPRSPRECHLMLTYPSGDIQEDVQILEYWRFLICNLGSRAKPHQSDKFNSVV